MVRITEITSNPTRILHCCYPSGYQQPMHTHERGNISLVLAGHIMERTKEDEHNAVPGGVVLKPAGIPHANLFGPTGVQVLLIDMGTPETSIEGLSDRDHKMIMKRWKWLEGGPISRALIGIWHTYRQNPEELRHVAEETLFSLPGLLENEPDKRRAEDAPQWLRQVRERIRSEYRSPPLVSELAAEAGVHPSHLTRYFKIYYGVTVTGLIRRCRVAESIRLMSMKNCSLAQIALDTGFADQSHLCRIFKRETGLTPSQYRMQL